MRRKLRGLLVLTAFVAVCSLIGCGGAGELFGIRKPRPRIDTVVLDRASSSAMLVANRSRFRVEQFRVYRLVNASDDPVSDNSERRYLNFSFNRFETDGERGRAFFVLSTWSDEAIDFVSTYYVLAEVSSDVFDYSGSGGTTSVRATALLRCKPDGTTENVY
ncbi:MAG: hypothetical protein Q7S80_00055 [bacterium]|nr:hypothetical protein [bacterium]